MEKSFRDILSQFLEEKTAPTPVSPSENASFTGVEIPEMHFTWQAPASMAAARKHTYRTQTPSEKPAAVPLAKTVEPKVHAVEHLIPLAQLSEADRHWVKILISLGATEMSEGLSEKRLKKAHRRLAKSLHPDMTQNASALEKERLQRQFMILQNTYEKLSQALPAYTVPAAA